jgi:ABC-2 type transport system ATP-binding protein
MSDEIILRTEHLRKHFGNVAAVQDVSLEVRRGEIYGFLGPNGAGKTTTIGMLLGLIHPTAGRIELFGEPVTPGRTEALKRTGTLIGSSLGLVPYLSARKNLELIAQMHSGVTRDRIETLLADVSLQEAANRPAGQFSTGMKQRLRLAMALLHQPELLVLDEPTNGMDPAGMHEVRNLLRSLADQGITVFISSHLLYEVEQISDRVAVLNRGLVVAQGKVSDLLGGPQVVRVRVTSPAKAAEVLAGLPSATAIEPNGASITVQGASSEEVLAHLVTNGIIPSEVTNVRVDLEGLFLELTKEPVS